MIKFWVPKNYTIEVRSDNPDHDGLVEVEIRGYMPAKDIE